MEKVSRDQAKAEVIAWLDKKKIFEADRNGEAAEQNIKILTEAIVEGVLVLDANVTIEDSTPKEKEGAVSSFEWQHELMFPIKSQAGEKETPTSISILKYKLRLNDRMLQGPLTGVKSTDADQRMLAYISALTGQPKAILANLDSQDKKIATAIVSFFV